MTDKNNTPTPANITDHSLVMERVFSAPRELVWQALTDPKHLEKWWGPRGWTTTVYKLELRPGGVWHYCMREEGSEMESWGVGVYREITPTTRLSYDDSFSDKDGSINTEMPTTHIVMDFVEQDGKTRLVSTSYFTSAEVLQSLKDMGMEEGAAETWDRLEEFLAEVQ